ncbi:MAG: DUF2537 domain-containing protein [Pseudonocardiaceae bacterium]
MNPGPVRLEPNCRADLPPGEPTPWATGLTVSAVTAVVVGIGLFSLSQALERAGFWPVALANLLVATGLVPSMWLAWATPIWRWVAYGTAAGIPLTWIALLFSLLGS